jgi:hypothetical protein
MATAILYAALANGSIGRPMTVHNVDGIPFVVVQPRCNHSRIGLPASSRDQIEQLHNAKPPPGRGSAWFSAGSRQSPLSWLFSPECL